MLEKVRAKHGIELPVERWDTSRGLGAFLIGLTGLFVVLPLYGVYARSFLGADGGMFVLTIGLPIGIVGGIAFMVAKTRGWALLTVGALLAAPPIAAGGIGPWGTATLIGLVSGVVALFGAGLFRR